MVNASISLEPVPSHRVNKTTGYSLNTSNILQEVPLLHGGGYSTDVYLNITYRFSSCNPHAGCTNNFVTLYKYDTDSIASTTEQTNKNNYVLLFGQGTENTDSRFQQIEDFDDDNVLRRFRPSGSTGFHLGIRDTGTCGYVDRILPYYTPCKKFQDGLVNYPELVRPPEGSPPNVAQACCAPNSHNTTSLSFRAYSDGRCNHTNVICECDAGYKPMQLEQDAMVR